MWPATLTPRASRHAWKGKQSNYLQVSDNGEGFDPEKAKANKSLGLVGMQERAFLLNGDLKIAGAPGDGTTMTLTIPLAHPVTGEKFACGF